MIFLDLFLLGTLSLWLIPFSLIMVFATTWATEEGTLIGALVALAASLLGFQFMFGIDVFGAIYSNPLLIIVAGVIHLILGAVYTGFWKFPDALSKVSQGKIDHEWGRFKGSKEEFARSSSNPLHPKNFLEEISAWILFWPFGAAWDLLHRPIRWLWKNVYKAIATWMDRISLRFTMDRVKDDK